MIKKVRVGSKYRYTPVIMDACFPVNQGLKVGDIVKVINMYGCPKANTMGQCYVEKNGVFMGMVCTNSLEKI